MHQWLRDATAVKTVAGRQIQGVVTMYKHRRTVSSPAPEDPFKTMERDLKWTLVGAGVLIVIVNVLVFTLVN